MKRLAFLACLVAVATVILLSRPEPSHAPGKPYHHLDNGRFRNRPDAIPRNVSAIDFLPFLWRRFTGYGQPNELPEGHALSNAAALQQLQEHSDKDSITWIGHACFLIELDGTTILTDPYLSEVAGPYGIGPKRYVPPGIALEHLPPIDAIVISHNHYDSLDTVTLSQIPNKETCAVLVPLGDGPLIRSLGFRMSASSTGMMKALSGIAP